MPVSHPRFDLTLIPVRCKSTDDRPPVFSQRWRRCSATPSRSTSSLLARSLPSTPLSLSLPLSGRATLPPSAELSLSLSPVRRVGLARTHALEAVALSPSSFSMASSIPLHFFGRPCPRLCLSSRSPPSSSRPPVANQLQSFVEVWKMAATRHFPRMVSHVILDLDGTLLNTDGVMNEVLKVFLVKYGKRWDNKISQKIIGRTPLEVATAVVKDFSLSLTTEELMSAISPMFSDQWCNIKALPGANRLIKHLRSNGVTMALASNSSKSCIEAKISFHQGWKESFSVIIGGDEVTTGKPSPEIFLEAAKRMNVDISNCLVIEDSLPGVVAGKAAGMAVVAVPSLPKQAGLYSSADVVINSLLDLHPEMWGLPPFEDWIEGTLPIEPWYIGGPVIKGFGRGSKVLGIPTANLPAENFSTILSEHTSGVYFGWAGLSTRGIYKMVMSIGWNPYFDNTEKTIEPWLLHDFGEDFYGEELRLTIVGYIRPEANFASLESLIARIHEDGRIAKKALDLPIYAGYKDSPYLKNSMLRSNCHS